MSFNSSVAETYVKFYNDKTIAPPKFAALTLSEMLLKTPFACWIDAWSRINIGNPFKIQLNLQSLHISFAKKSTSNRHSFRNLSPPNMAVFLSKDSATGKYRQNRDLTSFVWQIYFGLICYFVTISGFDMILSLHQSDVIMSEMASQITGVSIVCSSVCSGAD